MDAKQIRQFIVLSETRNFSVAAQKLHLSQSALSTSIRKLEEEFDCQLFHRTSRGVNLTVAGQAAAVELRAAAVSLRMARERARLALAGDGNTLRLGFVGTAVRTVLPELMARFCGQYPQIKLELHESTNSQLIERIRAGEIDAGLGRLPTESNSDLAFTHLLDDHLTIALPQSHPLAENEEVTLAQIAPYPFIHYTGEVQAALAPLIDALFEAEGLTPNITHRAVQVQTVIVLVEAGLGLSLVPASLAKRFSPQVAVRAISGIEAPRLNLGLINLRKGETHLYSCFRDSALGWKQQRSQMAG
ncbi:LysR substrate-binding domain-containing protein [Achromobacter mucicolens]|uniref:LysR family transcriptional regulator n=1 Tax=Achromobacter mucicolens TaxID=1389922 RepID=UPI0021D1FE7F|nr:LysR family transcriptional regulator [Achromobacter mucicolens]MCU6619405.1 LysR substrate-binding domain-containing protein [Achromobacter mucicolens]